MNATAPAAGDLLFFRSHGTLLDHAIEWRTGPGFVHVEIVVSATESPETTGALETGITRHTIPGDRDLVRIATAARCLPDRLPLALNWLARQVGRPYGLLDNLDDALELVLPHGPFLTLPHAMNCSHLAATFLTAAGFPFPADTFTALELITPNDLARLVIP